MSAGRIPPLPWRLDVACSSVDDAEGNQVALVMPMPGYDRKKTVRLVGAAPEMAEAMRGCSDGSCILRRRPVSGQKTNGGCKCRERIAELIARIDGAPVCSVCRDAPCIHDGPKP